jgi:chromosome segregation ATPase
MPEEWLTYREIGARLGLNVEAVRTRVRRAGWRTQPGNDGRTRVLVPDHVLVEPVSADREGVNEGVNRTKDLTGLVVLLTAAEARISRLEGQVQAERDRVNESRSEADRLRAELAEQTTRSDRAKQASTEAAHATTERVTRAEAQIEHLRETLAAAQADQAASEARADAEADALRTEVTLIQATKLATAEQAHAAAQAAQERLDAMRRADAERRGQGRWVRLRAAWRGE